MDLLLKNQIMINFQTQAAASNGIVSDGGPAVKTISGFLRGATLQNNSLFDTNIEYDTCSATATLSAGQALAAAKTFQNAQNRGGGGLGKLMIRKISPDTYTQKHDFLISARKSDINYTNVNIIKGWVASTFSHTLTIDPDLPANTINEEIRDIVINQIPAFTLTSCYPA